MLFCARTVPHDCTSFPGLCLRKNQTPAEVNGPHFWAIPISVLLHTGRRAGVAKVWKWGNEMMIQALELQNVRLTWESWRRASREIRTVVNLLGLKSHFVCVFLRTVLHGAFKKCMQYSAFANSVQFFRCAAPHCFEIRTTSNVTYCVGENLDALSGGAPPTKLPRQCGPYGIASWQTWFQALQQALQPPPLRTDPANAEPALQFSQLYQVSPR